MSAHTRFGRKTSKLHNVGFCWKCGRRARLVPDVAGMPAFCAGCAKEYQGFRVPSAKAAAK